MTSIVQTVALPVAVIAIASFNVAPHLDHAVSVFLTQYTLSDQLSFLAILFSIVFAAVSTSQQATFGSSPAFLSIGGNSGAKTAKDYPLLDIEKASTDKDKFMAMYPTLRDDILRHMEEDNDMTDHALDWCRTMMDYNVPGGKLNRGTTVVGVLRALQKGRPLSPLQVARASVCGWAIEFLQAFFLVADDVMDDSQTRRGQPCWYKDPKVKLIAINDSFLLESFVFTLLKQHFGDEPALYNALVNLMIDIIQKTEFGQLLDLTTASSNEGNVDINTFSLQQYKLIVKYKTAFYSFYLPVAMGMILSGIKDKKSYELAKKICLTMGEYFQVQDDYLDCFGDPKHIGKVGTDIQDNKCSWMVVQALERCSPAQRKVLVSNYGQWNDGKVKKVKQLYRELDLPKVFEEYEEASYKSIQEDLAKIKLMPREVFDVLLSKIYKRSM